MALTYLDQMDLEGKVVLLRLDLNTPLSKTEPRTVTDATRIDRSLPTINYILEQGAKKLILCSHLGRPKGEAKPEFSLEPVASNLAEKLNQEVVLTESCLDRGIKTMLGLASPKIILLQNLRYHPEEEANDQNFAKALSEYADIYVNDAFGASHRKHASIHAINSYFKGRACAGFLIKQELEALDKIVKNPETPFVAIVGGAKVSDKIKIIENLLPKVSNLIIGGAMAYPFLKAKGHQVGKSLCSDEDLKIAKGLLNQGSASKIELPLDHLVSDSLEGSAEQCPGIDIPENKMGLDIGEQTITRYQSVLTSAKTVLWNGPMGLFEKEDFSRGTMAIAHSLSALDQCFSLVGGGDSVKAVNQSGKAEMMGHISTGGGASLEYIEKGNLPGIDALRFGVDY